MNKKNNPKENNDQKPPEVELVSDAKDGGATVVLDKKEYEDLRAAADKSKEHWDRCLRQQADFDNIRKRLERDKQEFQKYAKEDVIVDLLTVLDDLERSVEAAEKHQENAEAFLKGIEMILAHLYDLLKKHGVAPIDAKGKKFDPSVHEALTQTETAEGEDGAVLEEMQKGYRLNDRVIRTAKVRVAKRVEK
jgi:molecular chaperone GrpE